MAWMLCARCPSAVLSIQANEGEVRFHCVALPFFRSAMRMYTPSVCTLASNFPFSPFTFPLASPFGWYPPKMKRAWPAAVFCTAMHGCRRHSSGSSATTVHAFPLSVFIFSSSTFPLSAFRFPLENVKAYTFLFGVPLLCPPATQSIPSWYVAAKLSRPTGNEAIGVDAPSAALMNWHSLSEAVESIPPRYTAPPGTCTLAP